MREILFRGKRADNGEWVEGCLATYPDGKARIFKTSSGGNCHNGLFDVIPETVGQYTGLTDKNGKRIFEGDILGVPNSKNGVKLTVKWIDKISGFWLVDSDGYGSRYCKDFHGELEIVGNVWDNPELLGRQRNAEV